MHDNDIPVASPHFLKEAFLRLENLNQCGKADGKSPMDARQFAMNQLIRDVVKFGLYWQEVRMNAGNEASMTFNRYTGKIAVAEPVPPS